MLQIDCHVLKPNPSFLNTRHTRTPQSLYLTNNLGNNF